MGNQIQQMSVMGKVGLGRHIVIENVSLLIGVAITTIDQLNNTHYSDV